MNVAATRRFTGDTLWNVSSLVFLAVGGLLVNALVVGLRGPTALGVFNQVYAAYTILSQLGVGGVQFSVLQQVSYHQDDIPAAADRTAAALALIVLLTVPIAALGIALSGPIGIALNSPDVGQGIAYVMPGLVFFAANKVLINVLNGLRHMRVYAVFRALRFVLIPAFLGLLLWQGAPNSALPLALSLAEALLALVLLVYIYTRVLPLQRPRDLRAHTQSHLSYGVRGMLSGVLIELNTRVDVLMLGLFLSDRLVGIYSFAAILAEGFAQLPLALRYNVDPIIGRHFADNTRPQITALSRQLRRVFLPIMAGLGVVAVLVYPVLYMLLASLDGLQASWVAFSILIFAHIAVAGFSPMRGVLLQGGAPGAYTLIILGTSLTNALINLLLIPVLGIGGAALATGFSVIFEIVLLTTWTRRLLGVRL